MVFRSANYKKKNILTLPHVYCTIPQLCRHVRGPGECHHGHQQELCQQVKMILGVGQSIEQVYRAEIDASDNNNSTALHYAAK